MVSIVCSDYVQTPYQLAYFVCNYIENILFCNLIFLVIAHCAV